MNENTETNVEDTQMENQEEITNPQIEQTDKGDEQNLSVAKHVNQTIEHPMITRGKVGIFKPKVCSTQCQQYNMEQS